MECEKGGVVAVVAKAICPRTYVQSYGVEERKGHGMII